MCVDMCTDMCADMCIGMCIEMRKGQYKAAPASACWRKPMRWLLAIRVLTGLAVMEGIPTRALISAPDCIHNSSDAACETYGAVFLTCAQTFARVHTHRYRLPESQIRSSLAKNCTNVRTRMPVHVSIHLSWSCRSTRAPA